MTPPAQAKALKGQRTWVDYGFLDLRPLARELRSPAPLDVAAAVDAEAALAVLVDAFGLQDVDRVGMTTPVGLVTVVRDKLSHIVEKRQDARERYVHYAIETLTDPFEVWRIEYDNGGHRLAFIGAFEGRTQMLVIVETIGGEVLWNFMHCDAKSLNKHRHGMSLYQRSPQADK